MDPFLENDQNSGGKLTFNLGNISEDVLKDGRKQYENGLPEDGDISLLHTTSWGSVVPQNQALVYAFSSLGVGRVNQDVGLDGYDEISLTGPTKVFSKNGESVLTSQDFGVTTIAAKEISGGEDINSSAKIFLDVIQNRGTTAQQNVVCANSGIAIATALRRSPSEGFEKAKESILAGKAFNALKKLQNLSEK